MIELLIESFSFSIIFLILSHKELLSKRLKEDVLDKELIKKIFSSLLLLKAKLNMVMVVHGEQGITLHQPMPSNADVILDTRVINCFDRGESKGAIIETETKVKLKKELSCGLKYLILNLLMTKQKQYLMYCLIHTE